MVACLELSDVPGGASSDDLCLAAEQFAGVEQALLLSPGGAGSLGVALLWLQAGADLPAAAAALDGHPLAGGFLSARVVEDPMQWVVRRVGSHQLLGRAAAPARPPPAAQPAAPPPAPAAAPLPFAPPHPGLAPLRPPTPGTPLSAAPAAPAAAAQGSGGGTPTSAAAVAAMEAELRELQAALQQSALEGGFQAAASASDGWGSEEEGGPQGWHDVRAKPARRGGGDGAAGGAAGAAGRRRNLKGSGAKELASAQPTTKLWMGNVAPEATLQAVYRVFGRFGPVYDCELRLAPEGGRNDQWGFVNFRRVEDAKAAFDALSWTSCELSSRLKLQYRPV